MDANEKWARKRPAKAVTLEAEVVAYVERKRRESGKSFSWELSALAKLGMLQEQLCTSVR